MTSIAAHISPSIITNQNEFESAHVIIQRDRTARSKVDFPFWIVSLRHFERHIIFIRLITVATRPLERRRTERQMRVRVLVHLSCLVVPTIGVALPRSQGIPRNAPLATSTMPAAILTPVKKGVSTEVGGGASPSSTVFNLVKVRGENLSLRSFQHVSAIPYSLWVVR